MFFLYNVLLILVVTCLYLDSFVLKWLFCKLRRLLVAALILPATYIEEVLVVALCLAFLCLVLLAEVTTT